jgi:hypothetical protein
MTDIEARDDLIAKLDPYSPFWQAFEAWVEARRISLGASLLRAGGDSIETARGKASMLTELLGIAEEKRENLRNPNIKGETPDGE